MTVSIPACVGQVELLFERNIEGWCWYPDLPTERALVDVLVNGRLVAATKAARMRTDLRGLEGCDGYCGFSVSIGEVVAVPQGGVVVEVRERRLKQTIGRIVRPESFTDPRFEARLQQVKLGLDAVSVGIDKIMESSFLNIAAPFLKLGHSFRHLSRKPERLLPLSISWDLAAYHEALCAIPATDLFYAEEPYISILTPGTALDRVWDEAGLDRVLSAAARLLRQQGAEFILIEDGTEPLNLLLPVRLRHLRVVQAACHQSVTAALNNAALSARGKWLAFAWAGRLALADLAEACSGAEAGTVYADATLMPPGIAQASSPVRHHGLLALCEKTVFEACGGFDVSLEAEAMWADFLERAAAVQVRILTWTVPRPAFQPHREVNEVPHVR